MFITGQHRDQIRTYFAMMNHYIHALEKIAATPHETFRSDDILQMAGERALHIALESSTDVGNLIIDALVMRDPSSYEDIIQVLADENVFPKAFADFFMEAVRYRRVLAHDYVERDVERLHQMITEHAADFAKFQTYVADYVNL